MATLKERCKPNEPIVTPPISNINDKLYIPEMTYMVFKKLFLLILVIFILTVSGNAEERRKPLPLKELQDPKSPSYVPIPYPQTDEEVITDLKHYFTKSLKYDYSVGDFSASDKIARDFLDSKDVYVGEIIRIKNELTMWERDYTFLIRLRTGNNIWVANICMNSNGRWSAQRAIDRKKLKLPCIEDRYVFKSYSDKAPIIKQIKDILGYVINENEKSKMQLVDGQCETANLHYPAWEIKLADGRIIYKSLANNSLYQVERKFSTKSSDYKKNFSSSFVEGQYQQFNKTINDEVLVLKEIWREK